MPATQLAYFYGTEAATNGRKHINKHEQIMLAHEHGAVSWKHLSETAKDTLQGEFYRGNRQKRGNQR